jgi:large subunit ribosomal protein L13
MDSLSYKTVFVNKQEAQKGWILLDAEGQTLGRFASEAAKILRGKNKPSFTPNMDCGDYVVIVNAEKINLTGKKWTDKVYVRHTGYPGGQRFTTPTEMLAKFPARILEKAIKGMLPKNRLGRELFRNVHVYAGTEHPHQAQSPKAVTLSL